MTAGRSLRRDEVEVTVEKGVYRGLGLARHEGQVVFVPRGLPGDRLRVRVRASVTRLRPRARPESGARQPSPDRRDAPCPVLRRPAAAARTSTLDYDGAAPA